MSPDASSISTYSQPTGLLQVVVLHAHTFGTGISSSICDFPSSDQAGRNNESGSFIITRRPRAIAVKTETVASVLLEKIRAVVLGIFSSLVTIDVIGSAKLSRTPAWTSWGLKPSVVIGHSLGEYAALNAAGVLSISDAIHLVRQRAKRLMERCTEGAHFMLAVKGSLSSIESAAGESFFEVACINGKQETVLTGTVEGMHSLSTTLKNAMLSTHLK
ncbi:MAG: hypothetical protein M1830_003737 [Pleopsidium flavum]|nr:MAG: hypothetical protein M1830_003737 [Pleopsidium flavum]